MNVKKIIGLFFAFAIFLPHIVLADEIDPQLPSPVQDVFYRADVTEIKDTQEITEYGQTYSIQNIKIKFNHGKFKNQNESIVYEYDPFHEEKKLSVGDTVIVGHQNIGGESTYYVSDIYRLPIVGFVIILFFIITFLIIGKQTFQAIGSLILSFIVIIYYLVPQILSGASPLLVSFIAALAIAVISLFWAHGFHIRTVIAFISTMITITFALIISYFFVSFSRLSGLGTEEAFFLQAAGVGVVNLKGLLLGGIIIGTLGILDDITTGQSAAVEEIYKANKSLKFNDLYQRGLSVGKEHIISLVNTLVLAYTSVALPLLLLFTIYKQPAWVVLNSEIIVEEVIRMLVGSTTLILAVPITTVLAAYIFAHNKFPKIPRKKSHYTHSH